MMTKYTHVQDLRHAAASWTREGKRSALVVTSGKIHNGHLALIRKAREVADIVVISLFTNPLQFSANEKFDSAPKAEAADEQACLQAGADALFLPEETEIYPHGYSTFVVEEAVAKPLCGISRPALFRGVCTFHLKLLNILHPSSLVLGEKDPQLIAVLRKMLQDLHCDTRLELVPTVRDPDGLACSTSNVRLTSSQRTEACALHKALLKAAEMAASGVRSTDRIIAEATHILREQRRIRVIYIALVNPESMKPLRHLEPGKSLLAIAAWIDETRLTDNIRL